MKSLSELKKSLLGDLQKELGLSNPNEVPVLDKVVVSVWIWSLATRKWVKDFSEFEKNLMKITGQKPQMIKSRKSISNFKLREWMPVMLRVTLRGQKAYDFIQRLVAIVLPRVRDFSWLSLRNFDNQGNLSFGFPSYQLFPELWLEDVTQPIWLQVSLITNKREKNNNIALFKKLGIIFA